MERAAGISLAPYFSPVMPGLGRAREIRVARAAHVYGDVLLVSYRPAGCAGLMDRGSSRAGRSLAAVAGGEQARCEREMGIDSLLPPRESCDSCCEWLWCCVEVRGYSYYEFLGFGEVDGGFFFGRIWLSCVF